jgi:hypothetical protein
MNTQNIYEILLRIQLTIEIQTFLLSNTHIYQNTIFFKEME